MTLMPELSYLAAFLIGLFSTFHCWGMCGGIVGALSLGVPEPIRRDRTGQFLMTLGYNLGRIGSYAVAGVLTGTAGLIVSTATGNAGHLILKALSGIMLIVLGLYLGGWLSGMNALERAGMRAWSRLQPLGRAFLPMDRLYKAVVVGAIWGWIPCGLVYSVLLWSASAADPVLGGSYMLAFGLGTLPGMLAAGIFAGRLMQAGRFGLVRKVVGAALILFGLANLAAPYLPAGESPAPAVHRHG